jgi:hypothetical protein
MYKDACKAEKDENEERIERAKINLLGEEPRVPVVQEFVEEEVVEEPEEEETTYDADFGISQYLVVIPFNKLCRCYEVFKYGE